MFIKIMNSRLFNLSRNTNLLNCNFFNKLEQENKSIHLTKIYLAGHSKWANIKHIKALKDGQKAAQFVRLSRQLRLAIQEGGSSNPNLNSSLRNVIDLALSKNMPMSSIQNSIKKFEANKALLKKYSIDIRYMSKIYLILSIYTDNFILLKQNMTPILKKVGATFIDAKHLFDENGLIETTYKKNLNDLEEVCTEHAIECGAEEIEIVNKADGLVNFLCAPIDLQRISKELCKKGYTVENAEHIFFPKLTITPSDQEINSYYQFTDKLKLLDGVEEIYDNLEPSS